MDSLTVLFTLSLALSSAADLYPRESQTRQVKSLDGLWSFKLSPPGDEMIGFRERWYNQTLQDTILMPVPSSFNDITQDSKIRDFVGVVWYETQFYVPPTSSDQTLYLRFGSVNYEAIVYLNGHNVFSHTGGHLPFGGVVNDFLDFANANRLTVAVNNTLSNISVPQATVKSIDDPERYPEGFKQVTLHFDFFNYAGIHRSVIIYTVPSHHIQTVTYHTKTIGTLESIVVYNVTYASKAPETVSCSLDIIDPLSNRVKAHADECAGEIVVRDPTLWWPYGMSDTPGYLYRGKFSLKRNNETIDVYYEDIGLRIVNVEKPNRLQINGKDVYLTGFGKHEDSALRGRAFDPVYLVKDFNLLEWIGANSFRTSHYPYSEELMQLADRQGIMIIDECPAVGLVDFGDELLAQHKVTVTEMIERDRNHPSVIMWSIANEPSSSDSQSVDYFKEVISLVRSMDTRPVTAAINANQKTDLLAALLDVLMINRYYAWYSDMGALDVIKRQVVNDFEGWNAKYPDKPILISEYGADTIAGMHSSPSAAFSEDYQVDFFLNYFEAFDQLREQKMLVGEMVWNFADFMTTQSTTRVMGNRKGIFTRDRQPKAVARYLRCRYLSILNITQPADASFLYCPSTQYQVADRCPNSGRKAAP